MAAEIKGDLQAGDRVKVSFDSDFSNASVCILTLSWIPESSQDPGHVSDITAGNQATHEFVVPTDVMGLSILVVTGEGAEGAGTLSVRLAETVLDCERIQCPSVWDYSIF